MSNWGWSLREWVSRLLVGGAVGCSLLLLADLVLIIPVWGPRLLKGDPRWETVYFVATFGLPASIALGAMGGLVWRPSLRLRLSGWQMACCCLEIAFVLQVLRPVVDRNPSSWIGPLFEVVPDTLAVVFSVLAFVVAMWRGSYRSPAQEARAGFPRL